MQLLPQVGTVCHRFNSRTLSTFLSLYFFTQWLMIMALQWLRGYKKKQLKTSVKIATEEPGWNILWRKEASLVWCYLIQSSGFCLQKTYIYTRCGISALHGLPGYLRQPCISHRLPPAASCFARHHCSTFLGKLCASQPTKCFVLGQCASLLLVLRTCCRKSVFSQRFVPRTRGRVESLSCAKYS